MFCIEKINLLIIFHSTVFGSHVSSVVALKPQYLASSFQDFGEGREVKDRIPKLEGPFKPIQSNAHMTKNSLDNIPNWYSSCCFLKVSNKGEFSSLLDMI